MTEISKPFRLFDNFLAVDSYVIAEPNTTYTRLNVERGQAVAVCLFNKDTKKYILVKQFRLAKKLVEPESDGRILELIAGMIDDGETPLDAAIRECVEETGYKPRPENIQAADRMFSSVGFTTEVIHTFYASVSEADKVSSGGGLTQENESIEVVHMTSDELLEYMLDNNNIIDSKILVLF